MMIRKSSWRVVFLNVSLISNLGMLSFFKYYNFFASSTAEALAFFGFEVQHVFLDIFLPVGISFYTFQTLSYTIDIYKGELKPISSFIDFALFVSFFPQLVAGPIERASRLLPQISKERVFSSEMFLSGMKLIILGLFKKLVIADNVAIYANQVFTLHLPSYLLLFAGSLAFTVQILADFSAYTDIARGSARLLGVELIKNFNMPYIAVSPSDFWRRWHISFSTWIRDYLYIPLGGSRVSSAFQYAFVVIVTMGLSGLWHGAAWNYVLWGLYHALLLLGYYAVGLSGRWAPSGLAAKIGAVSIMFCFTLFGWAIFRTPSIGWLYNVLANGSVLGTESDVVSAITISFFTLVYSAPLILLCLSLSLRPAIANFLRPLAYASFIFFIFVLGRDGSNDFIYFQF